MPEAITYRGENVYFGENVCKFPPNLVATYLWASIKVIIGSGGLASIGPKNRSGAKGVPFKGLPLMT
jgi:hypothetical protein